MTILLEKVVENLEPIEYSELVDNQSVRLTADTCIRVLTEWSVYDQGQRCFPLSLVVADGELVVPLEQDTMIVLAQNSNYTIRLKHPARACFPLELSYSYYSLPLENYSLDTVFTNAQGVVFIGGAVAARTS